MRKILFIIVALIVFLFAPTLAFAEKDHAPVVLSKSETVNGNYFGTGPTVDVQGIVNGDAYLAGGTIMVNGTINGDLLAAGGQITMKGKVHNMRVVGGQIVIDGTVDGNVTVGGGSITLTSGSYVGGSVVGAGGQVVFSGPVDKTITIAGGQVTIGNTIGGDASLAIGQLTVSSSGRVNGNLWYQSQQKAQVDEGATISGKVTHVLPPQRPQPKPVEAAGNIFAGLLLFAGIVMFVIEIIFGILLLTLLPVYSQRTIKTITEHFWLSFGVGILAWAVTPFIALILLVTVIGIPIAAVFIFAMIIFSYIGKIYAALFIGNWSMERTNKKQISQFIALLVGVVIFEVITLVPVIGWIFIAIMSAVGFGAVLTLEKNYFTELRAKKVI